MYNKNIFLDFFQIIKLLFKQLNEAILAAEKIQYPVMVRVAYALGGLGSGICHNEEQLRELCSRVY